MSQLARIKEELIEAAIDQERFTILFTDLIELWSRMEYLVALGEEAMSELPPSVRHTIEDRTDARILQNRMVMRAQRAGVLVV